MGEIGRDLGWSGLLTRTILRGSRRPSVERLEQLIAYFDLEEDEIPRLTFDKPTTKGKQVFISYSHKDHQYLDRLMVHLKPLEKERAYRCVGRYSLARWGSMED